MLVGSACAESDERPGFGVVEVAMQGRDGLGRRVESVLFELGSGKLGGCVGDAGAGLRVWECRSISADGALDGAAVDAGLGDDLCRDPEHVSTLRPNFGE